MESTRNHSALYFIAVFISIVAYSSVAYFLSRTELYLLIIFLTATFVAYWYLLNNVQKKFSVKRGYQLAIGFRLVFLLAIPSLSDDFYRFIWDGRLLVAGINPFSYLPHVILNNFPQGIPGIEDSLLKALNSPQYYSVYPPFCQAIFYLTTLLSGGSLIANVIWLRIFILVAEIVSLHFLPRLLEKYGIPQKAGLLYALNPLVIIELTGNLHFEAFMICFLILFFFFLKEQKTLLAASFFGFAVITKLIPLIFLPLLFTPLGLNKFLKFSAIVFLIMFSAFIPFFSGFGGFGSSLGLYFQKFEFNASVYFLLREIGYWIAGFNLIYWIGMLLACFTFILILRFAYSIKKSIRPLPYHFMWVLLIYLILSTTVHPWYITTLVFFSVFTTFRFPIVWSAVIFLTYVQYTDTGFRENLPIIFIEYLILFLFLWYELSFNKLRSLE